MVKASRRPPRSSTTDGEEWSGPSKLSERVTRELLEVPQRTLLMTNAAAHHGNNENSGKGRNNAAISQPWLDGNWL
jgi:hypothetical protein